jgi:hypothetical protein
MSPMLSSLAFVGFAVVAASAESAACADGALDEEMCTLQTVSVHSSTRTGARADPCDDSTRIPCKHAPWVSCVNARCTAADVGGMALCGCTKHSAGYSVAPSENGGAPCWQTEMGDNGIVRSGKDMCEAMREGALYATKDIYTNDPFETVAICPPMTPFAMCWGAECTEVPGEEDKVNCLCPVVASTNETAVQEIFVPESMCASATDACSMLFPGKFKSHEPHGKSLHSKVVHKEMRDSTRCYDYRTQSK